MRKRKRTPLIIALIGLAFSLGLVGFMVGYFSTAPRIVEKDPESENRAYMDPNNGPGSTSGEAKEDVEPQISEEDTRRTITNYKGVISENTLMVFRTLYTKCQSTVETKTSPENQLIGLSEEDLKEYYIANNQGWKVIYFSDQEVVLLERKEQICPQHYLVTDYEGYIAVYRYNEAGEKVLVEKTEIPVSVLPSVDQEKLKKGMLLNSKEEVDRLLEDFSS